MAARSFHEVSGVRMAISESGDLPTELRKSVRTSMFVSATLRTVANAHPVRVRNMSTKGTLIEAPSLPPVGTAVELSRGALAAVGTVAWVESGRCGLALTGMVDTQAWMSRAPAHQLEVDQRIADARAAMATAPRADVPLVEPTPGFDRILAPPQGEIDLLLSQLEALGDSLSSDEHVLTAHGNALQIIDEVQQRLRALARRMH